MIVINNFKSLYLFIIVFFCLSRSGNGQENKRALAHKDYDSWESISSSTISNDGSWVGVEIGLQDGDGRVELVPASTSKSTLLIPRLTKLVFSDNNRWAIGLLVPEKDSIRNMKLQKVKKEKFPKDTLLIVNLELGELRKIPHVKNYSMPADNKMWFAYEVSEEMSESKAEDAENEKEEEEKITLHVAHFEADTVFKLENVTDYGFAANGKQLYYVQRINSDQKRSNRLDIIGLESGQVMTINDSLKQFKKMVFSEDGDQFAFLGCMDAESDESISFDLFYMGLDGNVKKVALDPDLEIEKISEHFPLSFSKDGQKLFFGWQKYPQEYAYAADTTILDEERVSVDIWGWQDEEIQPMQLKNLEEKKKESFVAVYHTESGKVASLGDPERGDLFFNKDKTGKWAIALDDSPYRRNYSWDIQIGKDLWRILTESGEAVLLEEEIIGNPRISPSGKYAFWYSHPDSVWVAYGLESREKLFLTAGIEDVFYDDLHDSPVLPGSNGHAGWSADDRYFLVYGKYDTWMVDPLGKEAPVNLSNGFGETHQVEFRLLDLDPDADFVDLEEDLIFSGKDMVSMSSGFYLIDPKKKKNPELLVDGKAAFFGLKRSKDKSGFIYQKSTFQESPDIFFTEKGFNKSEQLTRINSQQEDLLWGEVELVEYRVNDGNMMNGLLFKPENFDPQKKYPMMVYFYERSSESLHQYRSPVPSASIINIPYFVSNGYLVFVPEIQYKIGLPGPSAYDCVVPGVQAMIAKGFVDPANIGIQGQSWGGYQVAYIITRTNMFKAAGAGAPVANMTSAYGGIRWGTGMSRMFQYEQTQSRIGGTLWEKPMHYLENSPLFYADRIQTPTLIMHNDADGAVPWYQGIEFFMGLKRNDVPSWLLVYNNEDHNLKERKNKKDLSIRLAQFFDHYLKEAPAPLWMEEGIPAIEKGKTLKYELSDD
ncbi:prolyl oligopeptidase family serine peptidase [Cyclobacterium sp. SYSU L10401]|uniref:S9 family peptidase n=1 Tax=Cyclobacterium sp. SYSU L10401 TaxID=2678657 RepID=UPI0013CFD160|nr:prolyl oligopeptidase family serine peptidase [Cyclobacterium sp. SYSU L10401]